MILLWVDLYGNNITEERSSTPNGSNNNIYNNNVKNNNDHKSTDDNSSHGSQHNSKIKHHQQDPSLDKNAHPRVSRASSDASVSTESNSQSGSNASSFINSDLGNSKNELQIALNDPRLGK